MGAKKIIAVALAVIFGLAVFADPMSSGKGILPGAWSSSFKDSKAYAEANNIPMLVVWANPGCSQCSKLEDACKTDEFIAWQNEKKILMVFGYGTSTSDSSAAKKFAKIGGAYPFVAIYWNKGTTEVYERFCGRTGSIPNANRKDSLQKQLIDCLNYYLEGWSPDGTTPPAVEEPTPEEDAPVTPPAVEEPTPEEDTPVTPPAVDEGDDFWREDAYKKTKKLTGLAYSSENDSISGTVSIQLGKINKRGQVKATVKVSHFNGKSYSAKATVDIQDDGTGEGVLSFKSPIGAMSFEFGYDSDDESYWFRAENDEYSIENSDSEDSAVGGYLDASELSFSVDAYDMEFGDEWDAVVDFPSGEPVYVKGGKKFSCDKAASIKYKKYSEDGERWYELVGMDDDVRTNLTGLKLSYNYKTGVFSGSFRVYISNEFYIEDGRKPKLKKITAKVKGVIVGGTGYGFATLKYDGRTYQFPCTLD